MRRADTFQICYQRQRNPTRDTAMKIGESWLVINRGGFAARANSKEDVLGRVNIAGSEIFFSRRSFDFKAASDRVRRNRNADLV